MVPVVEESVNPGGSAGDTEKEVIGPPVLTTVSAAIATPAVKLRAEFV